MNIKHVLQKANEIFTARDTDPKHATDQLIKNMGKILDNIFNDDFRSRYKVMRNQCSDYSKRYSKVIYDKYKPQLSKYNEAKSAFYKIEDDVNYAYWQLNRLSGHSPQKRQMRKVLKNRMAQLEVARKTALKAYDDLDEPQNQIDEINQLLSGLGTAVKKIQSFILKFTWLSVKLKFAMKTMRFIFWALALFLTFILDNYTSFFDSFFLKYDKDQYHTITILLTFIIQVALFEWVVAIISKKTYWLFYGKILKSFEEILPEVESIERSLVEAEEFYNKLPRTS